MSCIFTLTEDLDAEFPAVAARSMGLSRVPLLCAREIPVPGRAAARDPRADPLLRARTDHEPQHVYLGEAARAAAGPRRARSSLIAPCRSSSPRKVRRIPVYPAADGYALGGPGRDARLQRVAVPADPGGRRGGHEGARRASTATRTRRTPRCARALSDRYGVPANRIAIGNGSCDILLAAGDALLEPGAELVYAWPSLLGLPAPRGRLRRARDRGPARRRAPPRPRRDARGDHRRHAAGDRLQPEQPDLDRAAARRDRGVRRRRPAPRRGDPRRGLLEFNMLQDPDESLELLERHPNLVLLRTFSKVYGLCGLRVGYALCGSEDFRTAVDQVRQPFFCNAAAQAAALEALNHQDEVARRVERNLAERIGLEDGLRELGHRARRVAGQLRLVRPRRRGRDAEAERRARASPSAASSCAPAARSGRDGALRVTVGTAGRERALPRGARRAVCDAALNRLASRADAGTTARLAPCAPAPDARQLTYAAYSYAGDLARRSAWRCL